jgi:hypothetical protein
MTNKEIGDSSIKPPHLLLQPLPANDEDKIDTLSAAISNFEL